MIFISMLCFADSDKEKKERLAKIDQVQLQDDIQRFYSRFTSRIADALSHDETFVRKQGVPLLRQYLLYDSEALKITTSPYPVANFLDMLVFVKLNRIVLDDYWIPKVFGKKAEPLLDAFLDSEKDLSVIAAKYTHPANLRKVDIIVHRWRLKNPDYIKVEKVRLSDFSEFSVVDPVKKEKSFSLSGLFVDTQNAVRAVDEMVLVSNRALFLAQNMPLLVRLQMRLGLQEMLTDSVSNFQSVTKIAHEMEKTRPMIHDLADLAEESSALVKDTKDLVKLIPERKPGGVNVKENLTQVDSILEKANLLVGTLQEGKEDRKATLKDLKKELYTFVFVVAGLIVLCGLLISVFWWTGHYLTKKRLS